MQATAAWLLPCRRPGTISVKCLLMCFQDTLEQTNEETFVCSGMFSGYAVDSFVCSGLFCKHMSLPPAIAAMLLPSTIPAALTIYRNSTT